MLGDATVDELPDLNGLRAAITEAGYSIQHESFASDQAWAFYEESLASNAERDGSLHAVCGLLVQLNGRELLLARRPVDLD